MLLPPASRRRRCQKALRRPQADKHSGRLRLRLVRFSSPKGRGKFPVPCRRLRCLDARAGREPASKGGCSPCSEASASCAWLRSRYAPLTQNRRPSLSGISEAAPKGRGNKTVTPEPPTRGNVIDPIGFLYEPWKNVVHFTEPFSICQNCLKNWNVLSNNELSIFARGRESAHD